MANELSEYAQLSTEQLMNVFTQEKDPRKREIIRSELIERRRDYYRNLPTKNNNVKFNDRVITHLKNLLRTALILIILIILLFLLLVIFG